MNVLITWFKSPPFLYTTWLHLARISIVFLVALGFGSTRSLVLLSHKWVDCAEEMITDAETDQRLRDIQREYLDFLDDDVSCSMINSPEKFEVKTGRLAQACYGPLDP